MTLRQLLSRVGRWLCGGERVGVRQWSEIGFTDGPLGGLIHPSDPDDKGSSALRWPPDPVSATYTFPVTEGNLPGLAYALGHDCPLPPIPEVGPTGSIGVLANGVTVGLTWASSGPEDNGYRRLTEPVLEFAAWQCPDCRRQWRLSSDGDYWYPIVSNS